MAFSFYLWRYWVRRGVLVIKKLHKKICGLENRTILNDLQTPTWKSARHRRSVCHGNSKYGFAKNKSYTDIFFCCIIDGLLAYAVCLAFVFRKTYSPHFTCEIDTQIYKTVYLKIRLYSRTRAFLYIFF